MIEPFFMIYGEGQGCPTIAHYRRADADREARRLATANPGVKFYVLASIMCALKIDVAVREIDPQESPTPINDDGIPF